MTLGLFQGHPYWRARDGDLSVLQPAPPAQGELELAAPGQPQVSEGRVADLQGWGVILRVGG